MKKNTTINRRSFFKISTVAGGGMVLGFSWFAGCKQPEEIAKALEMPSEWYEFNAFLKIALRIYHYVYLNF